MSQDTNINMGVEQFLAAVLAKVGPVTLTLEEMLNNYSQFAVSVGPGENGEVEISLVDLKGVNLEDIAE